jgi:hypothetical protein
MIGCGDREQLGMVPVPAVQDPDQRGSLSASCWQVLLQDEHQDQVALGGEIRDVLSHDSPALGPGGHRDLRIVGCRQASRFTARRPVRL